MVAYAWGRIFSVWLMRNDPHPSSEWGLTHASHHVASACSLAPPAVNSTKAL